MESTILNLLNALELGEAQTHKNMTVFPLFAPGNGTPEYLTLKEALQRYEGQPWLTTTHPVIDTTSTTPGR
jgi:hypothetical protein